MLLTGPLNRLKFSDLPVRVLGGSMCRSHKYLATVLVVIQAVADEAKQILIK